MTPIVIDSGYLGDHLAACFLLEHGGQHALIEASTQAAVPAILRALEARGIELPTIRYLIVTHAHLDHAGGLHALARLAPHAIVVSHPAALQHLTYPKVLIAGTRTVFGPQRFDAYFHGVKPLEGSAMHGVLDGEELELGGQPLAFTYARGHANHHICVVDRARSAVFTGDAFGACYPFMRRGARFVVLPLTPPMDFDVVQALEAVEQIRALGCRTAYLTHYGALDDIDQAAAQLAARLLEIKAILDELVVAGPAEAAPERRCLERLRGHARDAFTAHGVPLSPGEWDIVDRDLKINAAGIVHSLRTYRKRFANALAGGAGAAASPERPS